MTPESKQGVRAARGPNEVDYVETADVTHVHAAIRREKTEPWYGSVPLPLWLIGMFIATTAWGFYYLGQFNGGFSPDVYNELAGRPAGAGKAGGPAAAAEAQAPESPRDLGKKVFSANCAQCHQATGLGVPGQYPPLAGSEYVNGTPKRLAMILLKGLQGPIVVEHANFNNQMPTWAALGDKKIAAVLTYVRSEWGNKGAEVTTEQIDAAKKEFADRTDSWTAADILAVPADATLPGAPAAAPSPEAKK